MKNLVNKGFKYFVAIMMVFSLMSMNAWANGPESGTSSETGSTTTENKGTTKDTGDSQGDTADQLISNEEKKTNTSKESDDKEGQTDQTTDKKTDYTYEDKKISVKAVLANASAISDQAELRVKEIPESTTEYKKYQEALNKKSNLYSNVLLYDISFMLNGKEVEPTDGNVKVSMSFKDQQLSDDLNVKDNNDLKVIHFKDNDVNKQETLDANTNVNSSTTTFDMDSFSVIALNTVDTSDLGKSDTSFDYENLLGDAINYGIVTDNFVLESGDAQTNVAAKKGKCLVQTGNDLTNVVEQSYILAEVDGEFGIKGNNVYVQVPAGDSNKIKSKGATISIDTSKTKEELTQDVQDMENTLNKGSNQLATHKDNAAMTYDSPNQKYVVDLMNYEAGTYYVTLDENLVGKIREADKLVINKKNNQTIVFNITATKTSYDPPVWIWSNNQSKMINEENIIHLPKFTINGKGSDSYLSNSEDNVIPQSIVWNIPNASIVNIDGSMTGIVLAPNATVTTNQTSSGWLYAKTVNIGSGEWHNVYHHIVPVRKIDSITFKATKNIDGRAATVNGFKFDLAEYSNGDWKSLQTKENVYSTIQFDKLTYDGTDFKPGEDKHDYIYRISEESKTLSGYNYDETMYYVKVTVTKTEAKENGIDVIKYTASKPTYYTSFGNGQLSNIYPGRPVFNNTTKKKQTNLEIIKVDADNNNTTLSGAKFILYKATLTDGRITKGKEFGSEMITDKDGKASFENLEYESTYLLEETQAPNGYKTNGPWAVQIDGDGKTTLTKVNAVESAENLYDLSNDSMTKNLGYTDPFEIGDKKIEYTLPSTGGIGTKKYYLLGTLLSMLGVIYIVMKLGKGGLFGKEDHS